MPKMRSGLLAVTFVFSCAHYAWSQQPPAPRPENGSTLTVAGQGEVAAAPDRAVVRLGTEAQAPEAAGAQAQVNTVMQRAIERIKALGIEERKIQTTGLQLYPNYTSPAPNEAPHIAGYRASNSIQVEVENLALIGKIIDEGVAAGANRQEGISFDLQNDAAPRAEALRRAVMEARGKADAMAGALGVRIAGISEVTEGGVNVVPPIPRPMGMMMARSDAMSTPVQPGELRVQASVTIRYRISENR
jgi:hypothetical protein